MWGGLGKPGKTVDVGMRMKVGMASLGRSVRFCSGMFGARPMGMGRSCTGFLLRSPNLGFALGLGSRISKGRIKRFNFRIRGQRRIIRRGRQLRGLNFFTHRRVSIAYYCTARSGF